ncbi:hypothetical protein BC829DRAFT_418085 [Chytridium lagenaria]|nr:hypothetical protein BC829DRAFT_418085 [Chytridium lagenaria]
MASGIKTVSHPVSNLYQPKLGSEIEWPTSNVLSGKVEYQPARNDRKIPTMLSEIKNAGPAIILHYNTIQETITIHSPSSTQSRWSKRELCDHCKQTLYTAFKDLPTHPDRFIYALAGKLFHHDAPLPFGGKRNPGFFQYAGENSEDLLHWIIEKATDPPGTGRGKKRAAPGEALRAVVQYVNDAMAMYRRKSKDEMDEAVLRGMSRAGHLENKGKITLPKYLRESEYDSCSDSKKSQTPEFHSLSNPSGKPKKSSPSAAFESPSSTMQALSTAVKGFSTSSTDREVNTSGQHLSDRRASTSTAFGNIPTEKSSTAATQEEFYDEKTTTSTFIKRVRSHPESVNPNHSYREELAGSIQHASSQEFIVPLQSAARKHSEVDETRGPQGRKAHKRLKQDEV